MTDSVKPGPTILAQRKVYIQWRKDKKFQLVVGGYAYLLPWTTVVLRCPTRHFRKGHIRWLRDGKPLVSLLHFPTKSPGYVKIQHVRPSDAGIYTCVAGPAQEHFVLQIIGSKQKLSLPEPWLLTGGQHKVGQVDLVAAGGGVQELPLPLNQYDDIVERLLELKDSVKHNIDKLQSSGTTSPTQEADRSSGDGSTPAVLVAESRRLDETMVHLSKGLGGQQVVAQLLSELITTEGETKESTLHPPSSPQGPLLFRPNIKAYGSRPRNPVMMQQPSRVGVLPSSEMVVYVGVPALLQKPVASLELRCEARGNPDPSFSWTKNGKGLQHDSR